MQLEVKWESGWTCRGGIPGLKDLFSGTTTQLLRAASSHTHAADNNNNAWRLFVLKYPPLSIAKYSFLQLSELEQCRVNKLAQGLTQQRRICLENPKKYPIETPKNDNGAFFLQSELFYSPESDWSRRQSRRWSTGVTSKVRGDLTERLKKWKLGRKERFLSFIIFLYPQLN